jgi:uncharacterized protein (UPF0264 family)
LFDHWPAAELAEFATAVRDERLKLVLAGSLSMAAIPTALKLKPDYVAVRGAVCRPSRSGRLDPELLAQVRSAVDGLPAKRLSGSRR